MTVDRDQELINALSHYKTARSTRRQAENRGASTRQMIMEHLQAGAAVADALELVILQAELNREGPT